jgi:hypothetical protein
MPARQDAHQQLLNDLILADDDFGQFGAHLFVQVAQIIDRGHIAI